MNVWERKIPGLNQDFILLLKIPLLFGDNRVIIERESLFKLLTMLLYLFLEFKNKISQKSLLIFIASSVFLITLLSAYSIPAFANPGVDNKSDIDKRPENRVESANLTVPIVISNPIIADIDVGLITLRWTAPGDDGYNGRATEYDLRYQPSQLGEIDTDQDWQTAIQVQDEPQPSIPGQFDSVVVADLVIGAQYFFCIRTYDEAGNLSGLSNSPLLTAESPCFIIDIDTVGCGAVYLDPISECYRYADTVMLTAQPCENDSFSGWSGDIEGSNNPVSIVVTDNINVTAEFTSGFIPGDANGDGRVLLSDITYLINYFKGIGPGPFPYLAGDANGSCIVEGADATYLLTFFRGDGPYPVRGDCDALQ